MAEKMRLAIVGGGIAGLAFAIALAKSGAQVDVDIYESTQAFSEIGAGMAFWPRVWDTMRLLGLEDDLRALVSTSMPFRYMKADQDELVRFGQSGAVMDSFHRAEFLAVLLRHLPAHYRTHFGKRLASYSDVPPAQVVLEFKDGSTATCDILIGADGLKSAVRRAMYERLADIAVDPKEAARLRGFVPAKWTGQYVYRGLVSRAQLEKVSPNHPALGGHIFFMGKDKYLVCYPVSQGTIINCGGIVNQDEAFGTLHPEPWVLPVTQNELREQFEGWSPYVQNIVDLMSTPTKWATNSVMDLPTYVSGRIALIGDAAHAMTPHQASGAGQGVEDALVLASVLAEPGATVKTLPAVLRAYDAVRRPFSQDILARSHRAGALLCLRSPRIVHGAPVPIESLRAHSDDIAELASWAWTSSAQRERDAALQLFRELSSEA